MGLKDLVEKAAEAVGSLFTGDEKENGGNGSGGGTIRIQYYRSAISTPERHKQIVRSVGFTKLNQIVERSDTPAMRGMVDKVPHLLRIVE
ncbi:MAG: 50S ribosomal protein L30 [Pyrinomonadaceae bacterium]|nr:50S ribosomal protein L30 [Pyrinomonadaceae bacterium]